MFFKNFSFVVCLSFLLCLENINALESYCSDNTTYYTCLGRNSFPSECIPIAFRCDGHYDCEFGDDEWNCNNCTSSGFLCSVTGHCIPSDWQCDGVWDCPNQEDELPTHCVTENSKCLQTSNHFICNNTNSRCLTSDIVCNQNDFDGCLDGQEEFSSATCNSTYHYTPPTPQPTTPRVPTSLPTNMPSYTIIEPQFAHIVNITIYFSGVNPISKPYENWIINDVETYLASFNLDIFNTYKLVGETYYYSNQNYSFIRICIKCM